MQNHRPECRTEEPYAETSPRVPHGGAVCRNIAQSAARRSRMQKHRPECRTEEPYAETSPRVPHGGAVCRNIAQSAARRSRMQKHRPECRTEEPHAEPSPRVPHGGAVCRNIAQSAARRSRMQKHRPECRTEEPYAETSPRVWRGRSPEPIYGTISQSAAKPEPRAVQNHRSECGEAGAQNRAEPSPGVRRGRRQVNLANRCRGRELMPLGTEDVDVCSNSWSISALAL